MSIIDHFEFYTDEQVNTLQTYIEETFTLDGTSKHLIRNILDYTAAQGDDAETILAMLMTLLDGIGITEIEILNAVVPDSYKLTTEEMDSLLFVNGDIDINISKISGCSHAPSTKWCEQNCPKYYDCHTIALANDMLVAHEQRMAEETTNGRGVLHAI